MFKKINLQFFISYLGLCPFITILLDKYFFKYFDYNIVVDFSILYSIVIFVFIGAVNWNLKKNILFLHIFIGFVPSLASVFLIVMFLNSLQVINYVIFFFIIQLIVDNFNYKEKDERIVFLLLRIPLTLVILVSLIVIQL